MKLRPVLQHLALFVENAWHRAVQLVTAMVADARSMFWLAVAGVVIAIVTLGYMHRQDAETDTRNGWTEIHKAMVNLRAQREFILAQKGAMGAYSSGVPNAFEERKREYDLATAQLRGQLDRLNDDSLLTDIAEFLDKNKAMEQWQTEQYEKTFDEFAHKVALKVRPK